MRETPRSLRAYFLVVGMFTTLAAVIGVVNLVALPSQYIVAAIWTVLPITLYGLDLLYAGVRFRTLLFQRPEHLERLVYASFAAVALQLIVDLQSRHSMSGSFMTAGFGCLISAYLLTNVRRLASEAHDAPPPPND